MRAISVARPRYRKSAWLTACAAFLALVLLSTMARAKDDSKSSEKSSPPAPPKKVEARSAPAPRAPARGATTVGPVRSSGRTAVAPPSRGADPRSPRISDGRSVATAPRVTDPRLGDQRTAPGSVYGRPTPSLPEAREPLRGDVRYGPYQPPQARAPQGDPRLGVQPRAPESRGMIWVDPRGPDGKPITGPGQTRPDLGKPNPGGQQGSGFYFIRGQPEQKVDPRVGRPAAPEMVRPQLPRGSLGERSGIAIQGSLTDPFHHGWNHSTPGRFCTAFFVPSCPPTWWPQNYCVYPYNPRVVWFTRLNCWYDPFWWSSGYYPPSYGAYSPWDYWGYAPYCATPWGYSYGVAFIFRPLVISISSANHYGGGAAYTSARPVPYDAVLDDIRSAWLQSDASYLAPHLHPTRGVTLTDADGREERISAAAFIRMTEDGLAWMQTEYFEYVSVRPSVSDGVVEADALHVFTDNQGYRQAVRVTYVLGRYNIGGSVRWAIERVVQQPTDASSVRAGSTGY